MIGLRPPGMPFYDEARLPSQADPPFAVPPDIVLDLPAPLSVNRTRKVDWSARPKINAWMRDAEGMFYEQKSRIPPPIKGRYEVFITLKQGRLDADNGIKIIIDTIRLLGLVEDDNPKHLRRLTVEFGSVEGCRVTIRPVA
jgi:hypothetical protein